MPQYPFIRQGLRDHEHLKNNNRIEGSLSEALEAPLASVGTGTYLREKSEVRCQLGSEDKELPLHRVGKQTVGFTKSGSGEQRKHDADFQAFLTI